MSKPDRQIVALDTHTGGRRVNFSDADNINGHTPCEPTEGRLLVVHLVVHSEGQPVRVSVENMGIDGTAVTHHGG